MNANENNELDDFIKKALQPIALEEPSVNFNYEVRRKLNTANASIKTVYQPLISKRTWLILILTFLGLLFYIEFSNNVDTSGWMSNLNMNFSTGLFKSWNFGLISSFALLIFPLMIFIQLFLIRKHFNQRLQNVEKF